MEDERKFTTAQLRWHQAFCYAYGRLQSSDDRPKEFADWFEGNTEFGESYVFTAYRQWIKDREQDTTS